MAEEKIQPFENREETPENQGPFEQQEAYEARETGEQKETEQAHEFKIVPKKEDEKSQEAQVPIEHEKKEADQEAEIITQEKMIELLFENDPVIRDSLERLRRENSYEMMKKIHALEKEKKDLYNELIAGKLNSVQLVSKVKDMIDDLVDITPGKESKRRFERWKKQASKNLSQEILSIMGGKQPFEKSQAAKIESFVSHEDEKKHIGLAA